MNEITLLEVLNLELTQLFKYTRDDWAASFAWFDPTLVAVD